MRALRVRHLFIAALAIGAVAVLPASAGAHPEACAARGTFSGSTASLVRRMDGRVRGLHEPARRDRRFDDSAAQLAAGESDGTDNLTLLSSAPKPPPFEAEADFNSDLAFENGYAFGGNYDGVQIWDVRDGQTPALASFIHCPGSQNDVTVNDGILVTSTDSLRNKAECEGNCRSRRRARSTASRRTGRACGSSTCATPTARSTSAPCAPTAARTPTRCCPSVIA